MDTYRPRRPADTTLHRVLTQHLETFLDDAAMSRTDTERVAAKIRARVTRLLEKRAEHDDHASDPLAACYAASLANAAAREPAAHHRALKLATARIERLLPIKKPAGLRARDEGFDLHAGVVVAKNQRKQFEHLCR